MIVAAPQKIKLLIFTPSLECGGTEKYIAMLCDHIDTDKFDVTLVVVNNSQPFYSITSKLQVIDLKTARVSRALFKIKKTIRQQQPDIIFSSSNHLNQLFAIFKKMLAPGIILIGRESSIVSITNRRAKFPLLYNWLVKKFYRRFDHIVCQSEFMQQDLIENFNIVPNQTAVIHNAVKIPAKDPLPVKFEQQKQKFITVGRLSEEKGIDRLIKAVSCLSFPFQYFIIGSGKKKAALQELIEELDLEEKIFIQPQKQKPFEGMEDAHLFLSGSCYEGFPNVLLEAGALGIPVIAYDSPGGTREIVVNGENGFLVNDDDSKAFIEAIERSLEYNFDRRSIQATTAKKFPVHEAINKLEQVFLGLYQQHD